MAENGEIQRRLEDIMPRIESEVSELSNLINNSAVSELFRSALQREYDQFQGMLNLAKFLGDREFTADQLLVAPIKDRFKGRNGVDPRSVPERGSWLSEMATREHEIRS